jgi:hypothetical protein
MLHRDHHRAETTKPVRETEAEAASFVVCGGIGLEAGSASQHCIQLYEGDAKVAKLKYTSALYDHSNLNETIGFT